MGGLEVNPAPPVK